MRTSAAWLSPMHQSIVFGLLVMLVSGCGIGQPGALAYPMVHAKTLLLDARAFPTAWQVDACGVGCDRSERQFYSLRTFGRPTIAGHVVQQVYTYPETKQAATLFQNHRAAEVPSEVFRIPGPSAYQSPWADEQIVACGRPRGYLCKAFFRYRNYVVEFTFDIKDGPDFDGMEISDITPILRDMDRVAVEVLGATVPEIR